MKSCSKCGSFAINERAHGREPGKHPDLCDVCYWREEHSLLELMLFTWLRAAETLPECGKEVVFTDGEESLRMKK
jgi:hypothetical protein